MGIGVLGIHHVAVADHADGDIRTALGVVLGLRSEHDEAGSGFHEHMLPAGSACVQTIEATGDGIVKRFLERRGPGLHHIAFAVSDLTAALDELRSRGVKLIDNTPRPGGGDTMIAFIHPNSVGGLLVELVEDHHGS